MWPRFPWGAPAHSLMMLARRYLSVVELARRDDGESLLCVRSEGTRDGRSVEGVCTLPARSQLGPWIAHRNDRRICLSTV